MLKFALAQINDIMEINRLSDNKYPFDSIYLTAKDEDKLLCYTVIKLNKNSAELIDAKSISGDLYLLSVTCKNAFNCIDLSGIKKVYCYNGKLKELLDLLKFEKTKEETYFLSLENYFLPCDNCKKRI